MTKPWHRLAANPGWRLRRDDFCHTAAQLHAMRDTCYTCYRPRFLCLCDSLPQLDNRTDIVVLQHPRERMHPFGSARMLAQSLRRARLEVAVRGAGKSVAHPLSLAADAILLYPRPDARDLGSLQRDERPSQVVLLDGTWSQAHRLYRDNPYLQALPHYRFDPQRPSRYLVRREPKAHCVSTLEAAVEILELLEPDLAGLAELLAVFERMNTEQVAVRSNGDARPRQKRTRKRVSRVIPEALAGDQSSLVVVYCESAEIGTRANPRRNEVLQLSALRLGQGTPVFSEFARPAKGLPSAAHLSRLSLPAEALTNAHAEEAMMAAFSAFLHDGDTLLAWNSGTFKSLPSALRDAHPCVQLKGVYCNLRGGRCGMLEEVIAHEALAPSPVPGVLGRAGTRLGYAVAVASLLTAQVSQMGAPSLAER